MFAVVKNGKFNGVVYAALTAEIYQYHNGFDEAFAQVDAEPGINDTPTPEQLAAGEAWYKKQCKENDVKAITVSVDGMEFDGDSDSQTLMERHANAMTLQGLETIPWKLADNTFSDVTATQLNQAVMLAAAEQRAIVVKYG